MKFKDIPQFIKCSGYSMDIPLTYFVNWIKEEEKCGLNLNPDFQRGHVWTEQQQIAYIEFLLRGGNSGRTIYFNCPDYQSGNRSEDFVCVDGLQRTTAILRFMNNEIPAFGVLYKDFEDKLPLAVDVTVKINELQTKEELLTWYIEMNEGGTPHSTEEINTVKAMLKALQESQ